MRSILVAAVLGMPSVAMAADSLVVGLRGRLASADVTDVNAHLSANWDTKMARLGRLVRRCDIEAMSLCAIDFYAEAHPSAKLTDELDRRVARLRKSDRLAASPNGQICIEAYTSAKQRLQ